VAVTLTVPGVVTAAVLFAVTDIWISTLSVAVKLGAPPAPPPVPVKLINVVVEVAVTDALLNDTALLLDVSPAFAVNANVTPFGTPLNVNRITVPLLTPVPLLELCVKVRNAEAKPSVMTMDARLSGIVRFVKIVAVPFDVLPARAPRAMVPIPFPMALMTVTLVVVRM
jgi:hypothetical protein